MEDATTAQVEQALRNKALEKLGGSPAAPTPTTPPVKPVAAGHGKPVAKKPVTTPPEAQKVLGAQNIPSEIAADTRGIIAGRDKQLADNPLPDKPLAQFTPEQTQAFSGFSAALMVMGALAGRNTMQPATAALNNMTGVMQGIQQGRQDVYKKNKEEFDSNYKIAMDNYQKVFDQRKQIMEESKGDLAVEKELMNQWRLQNGISEKYAHDQMQYDLGMQRNIIDMQRKQVEFEKMMASIIDHNPPAGNHGNEANITRLNIERNKELSKTNKPENQAAINKRFDSQIAALGGGGQAAPAAGGVKSFSSEAEAEAAASAGKLRSGDKVTIGGQSGTWQ